MNETKVWHSYQSSVMSNVFTEEDRKVSLTSFYKVTYSNLQSNLQCNVICVDYGTASKYKMIYLGF